MSARKWTYRPIHSSKMVLSTVKSGPTVVDSNRSIARSSDRYVSMAEACWATGVLMFSEKVRSNSLA